MSLAGCCFNRRVREAERNAPFWGKREKLVCFASAAHTLHELPGQNTAGTLRLTQQHVPCPGRAESTSPVIRQSGRCKNACFSGMVMPFAGPCLEFAGVVLCRALIDPTNFATVRSTMDIHVRRCGVHDISRNQPEGVSPRFVREKPDRVRRRLGHGFPGYIKSRLSLWFSFQTKVSSNVALDLQVIEFIFRQLVCLVADCLSRQWGIGWLQSRSGTGG